MKLQDLDIIITAPPAPGWGGRYWILVKVTTDTGITGWGECYASTVGPKAMTAVIEDVFARHMLGENPENIELMFRRAYSSGFTQRSTERCCLVGLKYCPSVRTSTQNRARYWIVFSISSSRSPIPSIMPVFVTKPASFARSRSSTLRSKTA